MNTEPPFDADAVAEGLAPMLGIVLKPEFRDGVRANFEAARSMARLLETVDLPDEVEPAPVFRA